MLSGGVAEGLTQIKPPPLHSALHLGHQAPQFGIVGEDFGDLSCVKESILGVAGLAQSMGVPARRS